MITEINIERKRADTKRITLLIKDDTGTIVDISGWTDFLFTVTSEKAPIDDTTKVMQMIGAFSTDGTDGRIYFVPLGTTDIGKYYFDVQAIDDNAEKTTIAEGEYKLTQDRTKD